jgi:lipid-A-disaccharide synthase-like uncharacterized protein
MRIASVLLALVLLAARAGALEEPLPRPVELKLKVAGVEHIELALEDSGRYRYEVHFRDGHREGLTPEEFADLIYAGHRNRGGFFRFLNITSPVGLLWVGLGLLGQVLFTGRMLVQWLASEKSKRSVIPISFWWMSLIGATLLAVYFIWRRDAVGFLGQATGWVVYVRNLRLIHKEKRAGLEE